MLGLCVLYVHCTFHSYCFVVVVVVVVVVVFIVVVAIVSHTFFCFVLTSLFSFLSLSLSLSLSLFLRHVQTPLHFATAARDGMHCMLLLLDEEADTNVQVGKLW